MTYQQFSRRARLPLGFALAISYLVFARPQGTRLVAGLAVALCGLLLRAWAAGHIAKNRELATTGPYAFVRNPLYLGSFLIAAGFALAWTWWFLLLVIAFFVLIYAPTMESERAVIAQRFPETFPEYERNVPAFVPRLTPWRSTRPDPASHPAAAAQGGASNGPPGRSLAGFSPELYLRHAEWKAALGFAAGGAWLVLRLKLGL